MTEANSSDVDEIVQVDTQDIQHNIRQHEQQQLQLQHHFGQFDEFSQAQPNAATTTTNNPGTSTSISLSGNDVSSNEGMTHHLAYASPPSMMDESTANGFTTAPATSEEDDDSDDDEDDSRSNYSNNNTNSNMSVITNGSSSGNRRHRGMSGFVKGEEKRSHHNVLERKRRDLLKDSFARLRDSVPTTQPKERVSRAEILRHAADFIASTVQKNIGVRAELDELIRKNRELEEKRKQAGCGVVSGVGGGGGGSESGASGMTMTSSATAGAKLDAKIKQES